MNFPTKSSQSNLKQLDCWAKRCNLKWAEREREKQTNILSMCMSTVQRSAVQWSTCGSLWELCASAWAHQTIYAHVEQYILLEIHPLVHTVKSELWWVWRVPVWSAARCSPTIKLQYYYTGAVTCNSESWSEWRAMCEANGRTFWKVRVQVSLRVANGCKKTERTVWAASYIAAEKELN